MLHPSPTHRMSSMPLRRLVASLAGVLSVVLVTGCTSEPAPGPQAPVATEVRPAELSAAWTATGLDASAPGGRVRAWTTGQDLVVVGKRSITAVSTDTGESRWTARGPRRLGPVCGASTSTDRAGWGVVLFKSKGRCAVVAAVDTERGRIAWTRPLPAAAGAVSAVTAASRVVAAVTRCGQVERWARATGKALPPLARRTRACDAESGVLGDLAVVRRDGRLTGFDLRTARKRWSAKAEAPGTRLFGIVSVDPLVLDESRLGHRLLTARSAKGVASGTIGLGLSETDPFTTLGRRGTELLGRYGDGGFAAYDLATGKPTWTRADDGLTDVVGLAHGRPLLTRLVAVPDQEDGELWLAAPGVKDTIELLGRLPSGAEPTGSLAVGERYYVLHGDALSAYDVPELGESVAAFPASEAERSSAWTADDVAPDVVAEACRAVGTRTLAALGFRSLKLPAPADCAWTERFEPTGVQRSLTTAVQAAVPSGNDSAPAAAARLEDRWLDEAAADGHDFRRLEGYLDDAWLATGGTTDGGTVRTTLIARSGNVVVKVAGVQRTESQDRYTDLIGPDRWASGVLAAAGDVLDELGLDADLPERGAAGPTTKVPDLCKILGPDGRRLVPGAKAAATTPAEVDGRLASCLWARPLAVFPELQVTAYAVPGALDGTGAAAAAEALFAADGRDDAVPGLGDEADVWGFRVSKGKYAVRIVTVRKGNLIVTVDYGRRGADDEITRAAVAVARKVLARLG